MSTVSMATKNFEFSKPKCSFPLQRFPETSQEADLVEVMLMRAMDNLTIDEHERLILDMHGVAEDDDDKNSAEVNQNLSDLERELGNIEEKAAYLLAKQMNEKYVTNRSFRLMFLRHAKYDVKAAAKRLVRHFELKRQLFGDGDVLGRDVRQSDLDQKDKVILHSGIYQILPTRDAAGRALLYYSPSPVTECPHDCLASNEASYRTVWYLLMKALEDEETQKRGIVWIARHFNNYKASPENLYGTVNVLSAMPHKNMGGHFCYINPSLHPYATGFHLLAGTRTKRHFGTREQIDFELQTFGIPTRDFPDSNAEGSFSTKEHCEWLAMLSAKEESTAHANKAPVTEVVIVPRRFDVLFGKDRQAREHTGTQRALHLVEMNFEAYENMGKFRKTEVAERIISIVRESGGRFLRLDKSGAWEIVDDIEARKKVAHWFRHIRHKKHHVKEVQSESNGCNQTPRNEEPTAVKRVSPCESSSDVSNNDAEKNLEYHNGKKPMRDPLSHSVST